MSETQTTVLPNPQKNSKYFRYKDITGQKFQKLLVLSYSHTLKGYAYWLCQCDCGNIVKIRGETLKRVQKSCGSSIHILKKKSCLRGHPTIEVNSRSSSGSCRACDKLRHARSYRSEKTREKNRRRSLYKYMWKLRRKITIKRAQVEELERILYEEKNRNRDGKGSNS